jgi:hypothetical protein
MAGVPVPRPPAAQILSPMPRRSPRGIGASSSAIDYALDVDEIAELVKMCRAVVEVAVAVPDSAKDKKEFKATVSSLLTKLAAIAGIEEESVEEKKATKVKSLSAAELTELTAACQTVIKFDARRIKGPNHRGQRGAMVAAIGQRFSRGQDSINTNIRTLKQGGFLRGMGRGDVQFSKSQQAAFVQDLAKKITASGSQGSLDFSKRGIAEALENPPYSVVSEVLRKRAATAIYEALLPEFTERRPQFSTKLRQEAAESRMNLMSLYSVLAAMGFGGEIPAQLKTNTDKSVLIYNVGDSNKVEMILVPKGLKSVTVFEKRSPHLIQRIDLLLTIGAAGAMGTPILIKKLKELGGAKIFKMKFGPQIVSTLSCPGVEVWFVPRGLSDTAIFTEYYTTVLPEFIETTISQLPRLSRT